MSASRDFVRAFPPHVEEFIFQHLSKTELLIASTVRGSWNTSVGQRPQTKRLLLCWKRRILDSDLDLLRHNSRAYQNVALDCATFTADQWISFVGIVEPCIVDFYSNDLQCSTGPYQIPPEWTFPHLRRLTVVDDWGMFHNPVHTLECFRECTGLELLQCTLDRVPDLTVFYELLLMNTKLQMLILSANVTPMCLYQIFSNIPCLTSLTLGHAGSLSATNLEVHLQPLPIPLSVTVTALELLHWNTTLSTFELLLVALPNLTLFKCQTVNEGMFSVLRANGSKIQSLSLDLLDLPNSPEGEPFPDLTHLSISCFRFGLAPPLGNTLFARLMRRCMILDT